MDKDLWKGLAYLAAIVAVLIGIFLLASDAGADKAKCIAKAMKDGVDTARIDKLCHLSER